MVEFGYFGELLRSHSIRRILCDCVKGKCELQHSSMTRITMQIDEFKIEYDEYDPTCPEGQDSSYPMIQR